MVIKDLLNKVATPKDPNDPEVKALREKLHSLQNQSNSKPEPTKVPIAQQKQATTAKPNTTSHDQVIEDIASASAQDQRDFAQSRQPVLRVKEERTHRLVAQQVAELIEINTTLQKKVQDLEQQKTTLEQKFEAVEAKNGDLHKKMDVIDKRLEKFMGLYEVITNQYNPFVDKQKSQSKPAAPPLAPELPPEQSAQAISVADSLSGQEAHVPVEQGQISSENAEKISQLLAELEEQERQKQDAGSEEVAQIETKEQEIAGEASADISEMLTGFEERLGKLVDDKMQKQLHATFEKLEDVLNEEIRDAVHEEIGKLKKTDDILESAFKELEALESSSRPQFRAQETQVRQQIQQIDDQIKAVPPSLYFRLKDGRVLKNKQDLLLALQTMPPAVFSHHVNSSRNDFADWLSLALKDPSGGHLKGLTREQMIKTLSTK